MKKIDWNLVGFVRRSKNRVKALEILKEPFTPAEIGREMKISLTHGSKIIRELASKKLVACLNDELKVGRIYQITELGRDVLKESKGIKYLKY